jgi:hypothetical protein
MIMAIPIFGQNIDLIITSSLEFYSSDYQFMMYFWESLQKLACIQEAHKEDVKENGGAKGGGF